MNFKGNYYYFLQIFHSFLLFCSFVCNFPITNSPMNEICQFRNNSFKTKIQTNLRSHFELIHILKLPVLNRKTNAPDEYSQDQQAFITKSSRSVSLMNELNGLEIKCLRFSHDSGGNNFSALPSQPISQFYPNGLPVLIEGTCMQWLR